MHIRDYALAQRYRNPRSNGVLLCSICIRFMPNSPICNNEIGLKPQLRALFLQNKGAFLSRFLLDRLLERLLERHDIKVLFFLEIKPPAAIIATQVKNAFLGALILLIGICVQTQIT